MRENNCKQAGGKIPVTATSKFYNYIQVRIFTFFSGGYVWCIYSYMFHYFTQGYECICGEKHSQQAKGCISRKGNVKIFVSHSTHISDFGLWGMLSPRLQVSFKLKYTYLL